MHELSLCEDLLDQVKNLARQHQATKVASITVKIGVLSGVEPLLLQSAFEINRVDTIADGAVLIIERQAAQIVCEQCGIESEVPANRLYCPVCQSRDTRLTAGSEMILERLELDTLA
ncbi:hydrogenase maturation nickel metallochaperone HypA [Methylotuvimicrobium alcaliphilum]|uniref:Hydrogenase maturation factor HypA n=1 Tax=Methylotuvimicrobium alcaliphilum (strain DSM 19304 / NCIMB 14124 / VKM B-2133 / 20Z) TaxID=1091494 RepID=G4T2Z4_META2|nr:hydrogenase maturation nickel metallochaperone HypA [Methylotuvimicrobium alcaliphilum]CCE23647.1 putative nickel-iron hydrogenase, nickel incorporation protein [Methylotuvimicrobium alcaliphilum 20Z]